MKKSIIGATNIATFSGNSFARVFGVISPKISTATVEIIVESVADKLSEFVIIELNKRVDIVASVRFTMLLPIKIVYSNLS